MSRQVSLTVTMLVAASGSALAVDTPAWCLGKRHPNMKVVHLDMEQMTRGCRGLKSVHGGPAVGCSYASYKPCIVFMPHRGSTIIHKGKPTKVTAKFYAGLLEHESCHCFGWPGDHRADWKPQ